MNPCAKSKLLVRFALCALLMAIASIVSQAQRLVGSAATSKNVPEVDTPTAQTQESSDQHSDGQTKRILGIIPNFRSVSANSHLPPQSVKDKFLTATQDSFDYSSIVLPAFIAGTNLARKTDPEFHQGAAGYGRYFWHTTADQTIENYFVEFIVPIVTHQDTRYYTMGSGGFAKRSKYALSRAVITRSDSGHEVFNASEVIGAGLAAGLSNAYYPSRERSFGNTASQWTLDVGIDAGTLMFKEFWPDINHKLFHGKKSF